MPTYGIFTKTSDFLRMIEEVNDQIRYTWRCNIRR